MYVCLCSYYNQQVFQLNAQIPTMVLLETLPQISTCWWYLLSKYNADYDSYSRPNNFRKALNGNSLIFVHLMTSNNGRPIGYRNPTLLVHCGGIWPIGTLLIETSQVAF